MKAVTEIEAELRAFDPVKYGKSRNFLNGSVTELGPYISRGIIDTRWVMDILLEQGWSYHQAKPFLQQLAWRDFYQLVWQHKGDDINQDIRQEQVTAQREGVPTALLGASTGIDAIDEGLRNLFETGLMHNHLRLYTAFLACHMARSHWRESARFLYAHLLDGDWASNALSWQWVAGTFSSKPYVANQENINHYTGSRQRKTFLDKAYEELLEEGIPTALAGVGPFDLKTELPASEPLQLNANLPVLVYNYYHLSPTWRCDQAANRVLLLEPEHFEKYPVSIKVLSFALEAAAQIPGLQTFVGSFDELKQMAPGSSIVYKEHVLARHYRGEQDPRRLMIDEVQGDFRSFFAYWKRLEPKLMKTFSKR